MKEQEQPVASDLKEAAETVWPAMTQDIVKQIAQRARTIEKNHDLDVGEGDAHLGGPLDIDERKQPRQENASPHSGEDR